MGAHQMAYGLRSRRIESTAFRFGSTIKGFYMLPEQPSGRAVPGSSTAQTWRKGYGNMVSIPVHGFTRRDFAVG